MAPFSPPSMFKRLDRMPGGKALVKGNRLAVPGKKISWPLPELSAAKRARAIESGRR
ncbi:hypothetical protein GGI03_007314, partial [Coemansia sp. RSA 2337]